MKFQIISDIHLEYYNELPELNYFFKVSAPNLILAGDICYYNHHNFMIFFKKVSKLYDNVFFIPGNHDYYAYNKIPDIHFDEIDFVMKSNLSCFKNVHFIQEDSIEFENTIIFGTTLWCKTTKTNDDVNVKLLTNEYYIKTKHKYAPSYKYVKELNTRQYNWLRNSIKNLYTHKNIIVVTHYLPSKKCINKKYKNDPYNDMYFTDCEDIMKYANIWIAGHTHNPFISNINNCQVFVNPGGDPEENTGYDKQLTINTHKAHL